MLKISCAGCFSLSPAISAQFTLEMCAAAENPKTRYFEGSKSFKVIEVEAAKKLVTSACYCDKQHICANLQPFSR